MKNNKPTFSQKFTYKKAQILMKRPINSLYSFKVKPFDLEGPFIIASNHITNSDQYIIMLSFSKYIHFMFDEGIYRLDSEIAKQQEAFGNIPYKIGCPLGEYKQQIIDLVSNGNNVCVFPELYTNYSGISSPVDPDIGDIVKDAKCTLVTYCFSGGYFTEPAWAKNKRKGWLNGHIVNVYSKYDLEKLSTSQVNKLIEEDIKEDAYARQCNSPITYSGDNLAEGLENVFYLCSKCGNYDSFETEGNDYRCTKCDTRGSYTDQGIIHANFRFKTVTDYYKWEETQLDRLADSDIDFNDDDVTLSIINDNHKMKKLTCAKLHVDKNGFTIGDYQFNFSDIAKADVDDKATSLVFTHDNKYYKFTKPGFKPLKYRKLFYKRKESIKLYGNGPK